MSSVLPPGFCDADGHVTDSWLRQPYRDARGHYYPPLVEDEQPQRSVDPQVAKLREEIAFLKGQAVYLQHQLTQLGKVRPVISGQPAAKPQANRGTGWQMQPKSRP